MSAADRDSYRDGDASGLRLVFFRTAAAPRVSPAGGWTVPIHGWLFRPEVDSLRRRGALLLLRKSLGLGRERDERLAFERLARSFLVDNVEGRRLEVAVGDRVWRLPRTGADGHVEAVLQLDADDVDAGADPSASRETVSWRALGVDVEASLGASVPVPSTGVSIVSDVDDTVKVSEVLEKRELLANTFLRPWRSVPGMADVFRAWRGPGVRFHYLSASPWQLYEPLVELLDRDGFPLGSFHLRKLRVKDSSLLEFLRSPRRHKEQVLEGLLTTFPRRRFVLVGDTGERDPEVYARLVRRHPGRIEAVLLRRVGEATRAVDAAPPGFPAERWRVFDRPEEIARILDPS